MANIDPYIYRKVVTLTPNSTCRQAALAMNERRIGCVVVVNANRHLVGILTDRDLACTVLTTQSRTQDTHISEVMTTDPVRVNETAEISEVIEMMKLNGVRRIPVIRKSHSHERCVGIITLDDLIVGGLIQSGDIKEIVRQQMVNRSFDKFQRSTKSVERSEARSEQTLNHFYREIAERTQLSVDIAERLSLLVLSALVRRLHFGEAASLIAQLPRKLHEDLLSLPAGPDRTISMNTLVHELKVRFNFNETVAKTVLFKFFSALESLIDSRELEHVKEQLPSDMKTVFS